MSACGLDFGTSNTTFGHVINHAPVLVPLESRHLTIPSAVFFSRDGGGVLIGRTAVDEYVDGTPGRLMRSLKAVLGTSLIDERSVANREATIGKDGLLQGKELAFVFSSLRANDLIWPYVVSPAASSVATKSVFGTGPTQGEVAPASR